MIATSAHVIETRITRPPFGGRVGRVALRVAFGALLVWVAYLAWMFSQVPGTGPAAVTGDHMIYMSAIHRWEAGEGFYRPYQMAGPYTIGITEVLYPPTIIPLLVVFDALPAVLWWIVPLGITAAVVVYWRPSLLGWTLVLGCLAWPAVFEVLAYGNPGLFMAAAVALGTVWGWPSVLVLLKPTLAPFALVGVRRRSWWIALGIFGAYSLVFLPMWVDYVAALANARGPLVSPLYSLNQVPLMLVPLVARWAATR